MVNLLEIVYLKYDSVIFLIYSRINLNISFKNLNQVNLILLPNKQLH